MLLCRDCRGKVVVRHPQLQVALQDVLERARGYTDARVWQGHNDQFIDGMRHLLAFLERPVDE